jgi:transposase
LIVEIFLIAVPASLEHASSIPIRPISWNAGNKGAERRAQLERELRTQGYKGSPRAIYRYLETLDTLSFSARKSGSLSTTKPLNPLLTLLAPQATWLFFRKLEDLKEEERENLRQLRQMSPHLETAYQLVEMFLHMVADAYWRTA